MGTYVKRLFLQDHFSYKGVVIIIRRLQSKLQTIEVTNNRKLNEVGRSLY